MLAAGPGALVQADARGFSGPGRRNSSNLKLVIFDRLRQHATQLREVAVMIEDTDPLETREWLEALDDVARQSSPERASFLLQELTKHAKERRLRLPPAITTPFTNTIAPSEEKMMPGDLFMERRIRSLVRWNALAMVMRANDNDEGLGGHISSFSSSATLYDVGFNYFFRGTADGHPGDLVFYQGHSAPGMYARSFLEGRMDEARLDRFRREVDGDGLSSYPHPWLMPDYWQFPTVSMGLGPIQAIYQAHIMKYQQSRGLVDHGDRNVWCFLGDGECDEPESLGAISLAGREKLGNLHFVVNCNLQRLDGPVRGNGKIIQELEGVFRGAGWHVIKVIWGRKWDPLLERDKTGLLRKRMDEVCDGELQNYKYNGGAYTREHFFGKYPELLELVADLSDDDIMYLNRGGHDPYKVYAAYAAASQEQERPTVILAMTVKGYGTGEAGEANNETHSLKKLDMDSLKAFRDRFAIPISDAELEACAVLPADPGQPGDALHARAPGGTGRAATVPAHAAGAFGNPAPGGLRQPAQKQRHASGINHHGIRAHAVQPGQGQGDRREGRAHRARRGAHLRHGGYVPAAGYLLLGGPALHAPRCRPDHVLQGGQEGADPRGGH